MHWQGLLIGLATFALIGIFHPVVIKVEYHFGARVWPLFLIGGLALCGLSLAIPGTLISCITAVAGFCMLWGIGELKHQEQRVAKGWFPANPKRQPGASQAPARATISKSDAGMGREK